MPDSAIATGCVDAVLSPAAIARALAGHADPGATRASSAPAAPAQRRSPPRPGPEHRLFAPAPRFAALRVRVLPQLLAQRSAPAALRIWVPGCSTGEEVYSLAICLLEQLIERKQGHLTLQLFGTDTDEAALESARAGIYGSELERDISPERLQRFFVQMGHAYAIRGDVRNLCVFAPHDPLNHPPLSNMDLISCPLLFDQLDAHGQAQLQATLAYALRPSGFLVLGRSRLLEPARGFSAVDAENEIYRRTTEVVRRPFDFQARLVPPRGTQSRPEAQAPDSFARVQRAADRLLLTRFAPPGVVVSNDGKILEFRGNTGPYLELAPGVPTLDLLPMTRPELRGPLQDALAEARLKGTSTRRENIRLAAKAGRFASVEVMPFRVALHEAPFFLIIFEDPPGPALADEQPGAASDRARAAAPSAARPDEQLGAHHSLRALMGQLESNKDELRVANEGAGSRAQQLQAANDQLKTTLEELQTVNEALLQLNEETSRRREASMERWSLA